MAYIALYRKYRPGTFNSILGQESVTKILKNQIKTGKISHAYLFSGTRGTGKTTAAKVFSRAINCLNPQEGEPCNECEVCKNILSGNTTDVIEMDAASNNSVENIRQIRQEVVYATVDVKYRVYIIDEVHMLTTSAFNALLKTLEEPPANVVFILATTEQHKIPVTILSRCLRFEFNRISEEHIIERLEYVLKEENIGYEKEALEYIAKLADGGMRDALSILDRCVSESQDKLEYSTVLNIVGAIDRQVIQDTVKNILDYDSIKANENVEQVIKKGKDLRQFVYELNEELLSRLIAENQEKTLKNRYIKIIDRLSRLDNELRQSIRPAIVLKACIVEICSYTESSNSASDSSSSNISKDINVDVLLKKISSLEAEIESLKGKISNVRQVSVSTINNEKKTNSIPVNNVNNSTPNINISEQKVSKTSSATSDVKYTVFNRVEDFKKQVIESGKLKLYSALAGANIYETDEFIAIITTNSFAYNILKLDESTSNMKNIFAQKFGINKPLRVELNEKNEDDTLKIEKLFNENDVKYTKID